MKKLLPLLLCILLLSGCAATYDGPTTAKSVLTSVEKQYSYFDGEVTQTYRTEYAYDIYGNQSVILEYQDDEPHLKTVLRYDEAGNCIRQTQYNVEGWFPRQIVDNHYRYDEQNRMIGSTHSEEPEVTIVYDDEAHTRTTFQYTTIVEYFDENGWVMRIEYPDTGNWEEYDRRADGEWTALHSYENGVLVSTLLREFDDQGRVTRQYTVRDGEASTGFRWEYGENWEVQYQPDGSKTTTTYHDDGTKRFRYCTDADGVICMESYYHYTEIQVPAGEEETP